MTSEIPQSTMMSTPMPHPGMGMPPNGYMGYPGMGMMPSTSNGIMNNFSMEDPNNMRNSGSPMMMQQQAQNSPIIGGPGPSNFMGPGHPQFPSSMASFHSQNPSQYSSNGQPQQPPHFQNPNMSQQYFSNQQQQQLQHQQQQLQQLQQQQQQQIPSNASPSRLNTPNYPPSNASNANNTPTYPNHNGTPTYPNPSNMQQQQNGAPSYSNNNGPQIQNYPSQMSSEFLQAQQQDERGNSSSTNADHMSQNFQNSEENNGYNNFINNRDMNGFQGGPGSMPPPPSSFQRQMSTTSNVIGASLPPPSLKKSNPNKTMLFTSDMLNEMVTSCKEGSTPENWHATFAQQQPHNANPKSSTSQRKRKIESSPNYPNANNIPAEFNVPMVDFQSPLSNSSLPEISGASMINGSQMLQDNYGPKREKKEDDGPLQCIERMTQQTLDRSPKLANRVDTSKRQEDKRNKMLKLELIASDLNLGHGDFSQCPPRPMSIPPQHPSMMMSMPPGAMRPPFPPGFDPNNMQHNPNIRPQMFPPGHPAFNPGPMPPGFMPSSNPAHSQNGMMPPYGNGMASASPKFPMMGQPSMISPQQMYQMQMERGMRPPPPMNEMMWQQQQQQQRQQMLQMQQQQSGQMPM
jgi:hypothetical protein